MNPIESAPTIRNQERAKGWEYRILDVKKADEGGPNNTAIAVL